MKAPDKIYIREYPDGLANFWESKKKDDVVATLLHEYIRKDTLMEWAKEKANDYKGTANIRRSFEMMINKIESL